MDLPWQIPLKSVANPPSASQLGCIKKTQFLFALDAHLIFFSYWCTELLVKILASLKQF